MVMKNVLINFAQNIWYNAQKLNSSTGIKYGGFSHVYQHSLDDIDPGYVEDCKAASSLESILAIWSLVQSDWLSSDNLDIEGNRLSNLSKGLAIFCKVVNKLVPRYCSPSSAYVTFNTFFTLFATFIYTEILSFWAPSIGINPI